MTVVMIELLYKLFERRKFARLRSVAYEDMGTSLLEIIVKAYSYVNPNIELAFWDNVHPDSASKFVKEGSSRMAKLLSDFRSTFANAEQIQGMATLVLHRFVTTILRIDDVISESLEKYAAIIHPDLLASLIRIRWILHRLRLELVEAEPPEPYLGPSDEVQQVMDTLEENRPEQIALMIDRLCDNLQEVLSQLARGQIMR